MILFGNNTISNQEIQFKLTQNVIEFTPQKVKQSRRFDEEVSLQFSLSKISIDDGLDYDFLTLPQNLQKIIKKKSDLTAASTRNTISLSQRNTARNQIQSNRLSVQKQRRSRKSRSQITVNKITLDENLNCLQNILTREKSRQVSLEKIKLRKSISNNKKSAKNLDLKPMKVAQFQEHELLSKLLQIKAFGLKDNEIKEKTYFKKRIQNRALMLHFNQESYPIKKRQNSKI